MTGFAVRCASISLLCIAPARASDLTVELRPSAAAAPRAEVELVVKWRNAWSDERSHDAVWLVVRDRNRALAPIVKLKPTGARSLDGGTRAAQIAVSADGVGAFVRPVPAAASDRLDAVELRLALALAEPAAGLLAAAGLEMVFIPAGAFEAGDADPKARELSSFYRAAEPGVPPTRFEVHDEREIAVADSAGALWYESGRHPEYRGDQRGPIPAHYPKGTRAFYVMKREFHQSDYAEFLNAMTPEARARRRFVPRTEDKEVETSSLVERDGRIVAIAPRRPLNFVTWDDSCALLDWCGLRPMSELEFEKAARGPRAPMPLDFPWGTADASAVKRRVERSRDLRHAATADEAVVDEARRVAVGASYYGVLDLAGSVWERVVSAGHPIGRAFRGTHGDGQLDAATGNASNEDWPCGNATGREADGIGYRGGAEYFAAETDLTNPFSIVAARTYAAWNGAQRYHTYSARGVRTAE
jgi:hypothetical protein